MRKVDRTTEIEPAILKAPDKDGKSELDRVSDFMAKPLKPGEKREAFPFARYKEVAVKAALERLFHGKCAYCESFYAGTQPIDVEHYRPKGEVDGLETHGGYWWLAMDWRNLLPSCIDCNRRRKQKSPDPKAGSLVELRKNGDFDRTKQILLGKSSIFPLETETGRASKREDDLSAERRLLLDPTRDDPADHLVFHIDRQHLIGLVLAKPLANGGAAIPQADPTAAAALAGAKAAQVSPMGMVSIQVYGLNRLSLVQARTKVLRDLEFLLELNIGLGDLLETLGVQLKAKNAKLKMVGASDKTELEKDIAFNKKIVRKIGQLQQKCLSQLRNLAMPEAPFSELARAWINAYLNGP